MHWHAWAYYGNFSQVLGAFQDEVYTKKLLKVEVQNVTIHERYFSNNTSIHNDIALLRVSFALHSLQVILIRRSSEKLFKNCAFSLPFISPKGFRNVILGSWDFPPFSTFFIPFLEYHWSKHQTPQSWLISARLTLLFNFHIQCFFSSQKILLSKLFSEYLFLQLIRSQKLGQMN